MAFAFGQDGTGWTKIDYNASTGGRAFSYGAGYAAQFTGNMVTAYLECGANFSSSTVKVCVYNSSDALLAVSDAISVTSAGLKSAALNAVGGLGITNAATYKIVVVSNAGYWNAKKKNDGSNFAGPTWAAANFSYASPPSTLPGGDDYNASEIVVYIDGTAGGGTPTITSVTPTILADGQVGIVIVGTNFKATQSTGTVKISPTDNVADGGAIAQTVTAWSDTSITITASRSTLTNNANLYLFVTNSDSASNAAGSVVQFGILPQTRLYGAQGSLRTLLTM